MKINFICFNNFYKELNIGGDMENNLWIIVQNSSLKNSRTLISNSLTELLENQRYQIMSFLKEICS